MSNRVKTSLWLMFFVIIILDVMLVYRSNQIQTMRAIAINHGCAEYNPQNGEFQWTEFHWKEIK